MKKFIFIDTNIYLYCALLTKDKKHNSELISKLITVSEAKKGEEILLLLPEVVRLEYTRKVDEIFKQEKRRVNELKMNVLKQMETGVLKIEQSGIETAFNKIIKKIEENRKNADIELNKLFSNKEKTNLLEITPSILVNAYKRALEGKKPFSVEKE